MYIQYSIECYAKENRFLEGYEFSKILNKLKKTSDNFAWLKKYSSKAIKDAIMRGDKSFKRFFNKTSKYPKFKSRKRLHKESFFIVKDNIHYTENKNVIQLPILGKVRIIFNDRLPDNEDQITGGSVIREYDKYFVALRYESDHIQISHSDNNNMGIDLGLVDYATVAYPVHPPIKIKHVKELNTYKSINARIEKLQQIISHKAEINYGKLYNEYLTTHRCESPNAACKNAMRGESYKTSRIRHLRRKIRALYSKKKNIQYDYRCKLVDMLTAKTKPSVITIENLDISEMIKHTNASEKALHRCIKESGFYKFRLQLEYRCNEYGIKLRIANKYFASSKKCSCCGNKAKNLRLEDRVYHCKVCGLSIDRDINAAINLLELPDNKCEIK